MLLPVEFTEKMKGLLGSEYEDFSKSLKEQRYYGLRVNTLKISVDEFLKISPFTLQKIPWTKEGFYYNENARPAKHPYYHAGLYYIQEPSAMAPGEVIGVKPKEKVLDLCASPGGKSTQIAAKLAGEGLLVANDVNASRIKPLVKNIELYGIKNTVITNESPEKLADKFPSFFDKIIVDAPCSGEGMFRKHEKASKNWSIFSTDKCSGIQKSILNMAAKMLKPQGYMLYSTCTFSPEENEQIIDEFLSQNKNFELIDIPKHSGIESGRSEWANNNTELKKCARFWPHKVKGEGHFLALLRKSDGESSKHDITYNKVDNTKLKYFYDFCKQNLNIYIDGIFEIYGQCLYLIPEGLPSLKGIKVIRPGWFLGMIKKERFEPSHALAMAIKTLQVKNVINFESNSDEVIKYLKGQTLQLNAPKGWILVSVDNFPLGWAKGMEGILKNCYPSGWRLI